MTGTYSNQLNYRSFIFIYIIYSLAANIFITFFIFITLLSVCKILQNNFLFSLFYRTRLASGEMTGTYSNQLNYRTFIFIYIIYSLAANIFITFFIFITLLSVCKILQNNILFSLFYRTRLAPGEMTGTNSKQLNYRTLLKSECKYSYIFYLKKHTIKKHTENLSVPTLYFVKTSIFYLLAY